MTLTRQATKAEARMRADAIRHHAETLWSLLLTAWENDDHLALGYDSWQAYVTGEFDMSRGQSYRLLDQAVVTRAIEGALEVSRARDTESTAIDGPVVVSGRQAQVLKDDLPKVSKEVVRNIERGMTGEEAVRTAVEKRATPVGPSAPKVVEAKATPAGKVPTRRASPLPMSLIALVRLDPYEAARGVDRQTGNEAVRETRAWLDMFERGLQGRKPEKKGEPCAHPIARRIGKLCGACGGPAKG